MSGSEDIVGRRLRKDASDLRDFGNALEDGYLKGAIADHAEAGADLIDRLTTAKEEWRQQALDMGTRVGRLVPENARLTTVLEYFSTIGGHGYMLPINSPHAEIRQMVAVSVVQNVARTALGTASGETSTPIGSIAEGDANSKHADWVNSEVIRGWKERAEGAEAALHGAALEIQDHIVTNVRLSEQVETHKKAILDIDAHATPFGSGEWAEAYVISAGSLHRALGVIGHTAVKCWHWQRVSQEKHEQAGRDESGYPEHAKPCVVCAHDELKAERDALSEQVEKQGKGPLMLPTCLLRCEWPPNDGVLPGDAQFDALFASIQECGMVREPILINLNWQIIDGAHRISAARMLGIERVPVRIWTGTEFVPALNGLVVVGEDGDDVSLHSAAPNDVRRVDPSR